MTANSAMIHYLQQSETVVIPAAVLARKRVADALATPITTKYGLVLAERWAAAPTELPVWNRQLAHLSDETGYECSENHIHIDWLTRDRSLPALVHLRLGLLLCERLVARLQARSDAVPARVIMSFDGRYCVVRFHKLREGQLWLASDLEGYQEGVLFLDT